MGKKYSVIVPIYKVEKYIEKCITSIINQTYRNIQIILVDDGSPDNCLNICKSFSDIDDRVIVIHKENGGLVSARKAGAAVAMGDYIVCVDGDDWIEPDYIATIDKILESYAYDVVCTNYYVADDINKTPQIVHERLGAYNKEDLEREVYPHLIQAADATSFLPTVWAKAFKRDLYTTFQMGVDNRIAMGEDGACTIPLIYKAESMFILNTPLYNYRVNNNSMTKAKRSQSWSSFYVIIQYLLKVLDMSNPAVQDQMNRRIAKSFFNVAKSRFNEKKKYKDIKCEILNEIKSPVVRKAVYHCKFTGSIKGYIISITLKCRLIRLLWVLNKVE
ncbi:MAG: glycosyltransferase [Eubacterium sp.]|nr:glycosyltransferase [Eubacterium sp.]